MCQGYVPPAEKAGREKKPAGKNPQESLRWKSSPAGGAGTACSVIPDSDSWLRDPEGCTEASSVLGSADSERIPLLQKAAWQEQHLPV